MKEKQILIKLTMKDQSIIYRCNDNISKVLSIQKINAPLNIVTKDANHFHDHLQTNKKLSDYSTADINTIQIIDNAKIQQIEKVMDIINNIRELYQVRTFKNLNYEKILELPTEQFNQLAIKIISLNKLIKENQKELLDLTGEFQTLIND